MEERGAGRERVRVFVFQRQTLHQSRNMQQTHIVEKPGGPDAVGINHVTTPIPEDSLGRKYGKKYFAERAWS